MTYNSFGTKYGAGILAEECHPNRQKHTGTDHGGYITKKVTEMG